MGDLISDSFTIIRNAVLAKKEDALIPYSKLLLKVCEILKDEGYIDNFKIVEFNNLKKIKVYLKYEMKKSVLHQIVRISKPQRRIYVKAKEIKDVLSGYGISIISTSKGVLSNKQAKKLKVGGELIGLVW
ncbi:MAG: 30S ribosomal protein S8 [Candidatus Omnitrophica bacterium]|nr:30S ribosomal protein S8 [Candidatus Omnitrophota bacterium]